MHNEPTKKGAGQSGGPQFREAFERLVQIALDGLRHGHFQCAGRGGLVPSENHATAQPTAGRLPEDLALVPSGQPGLTLDRYATAKRLPIDFLKRKPARRKGMH
jgi:hypothetical protein